MTCKDCIHYTSHRHFDPLLDEVYTDEDVEYLCPEFKDKSRFVELPCKVGDTIYWIDCIGGIIEEKVKSFTVGIENENGSFPIGHFGSSLFTTKEEAEKKLGEMKK